MSSLKNNTETSEISEQNKNRLLPLIKSMNQQDFMDNTVFEFIQDITGNYEIEWNIELIGDVRTAVQEVLARHDLIDDAEAFYPDAEEDADDIENGSDTGEELPPQSLGEGLVRYFVREREASPLRTILEFTAIAVLFILVVIILPMVLGK